MSSENDQTPIERVDARVWLQEKAATHLFKGANPYQNGNKEERIERSIVLLFDKEKKETEPEPRKGLYLVTDEDDRPTQEEFLVEAGSEVVIYRRFKRSPKNETVASFLLKDGRIAYVRGDGYLRFRHVAQKR